MLSNLEADDRYAFLRSLSVMCVPTRRPEAFGMHMLEALASGVPVVQPDHGAYSEVLGMTGGGVLVPPGNAAALADALRTTLADLDEARQRAAAARQVIADRFTATRMAQDICKVYATVTDTRPTAGQTHRT
jgi:glycosyltransferase involved in cell wall biosynthesis